MSAVNRDTEQEARIIESWHNNARPWAKAISDKQITSRETVTNHAILDAVQQGNPRSLIDIGCGEGWLCRMLESSGIRCLGVDAIPKLLDSAKKYGGEYRQCAYEDLATADFGQRFDCAVSNFALLGKHSSEAVFAAVPRLLSDNGRFIVQTLHPETACGDLPYKDGWREGSWAGFSEDFDKPAPWYFRTLSSWEALFPTFGLELIERWEPCNPTSGDRQSLVLIARLQVKPR